jgi:hypothetical protein
VGGAQESGNVTLSPSPTTGARPLPDPLAGLAAPSGGTVQGAVNLTSGSLTINPGIYSQITVSGNANLTLVSGTYVIEGGGLTVSGSGSITGSGVMIYNAGSSFPKAGGSFGAITLSGNGKVNLTAPTTGPDAGDLIFQSRDNAKAISIAGNSSLRLSGAIYAPAAPLNSSSVIQGALPLVVNELVLSGNASTALTAAVGSAGAPLDVVAVSDMALAQWPPSGPSVANGTAALTSEAPSPGGGGPVGPLLSRNAGAMPVLQGPVVDSALECFGALPSLLSRDGGSRPGHQPEFIIQAL